MWRAFAWIQVMLYMCAEVSVWADRPVLVELYHSSQDCTTCPIAVEAIQEIRKEYSPAQVHFLSFPMNDELQTTSGLIRYRFGYGAPPFPTVYFDGSNRISGADSRVANAYRRQIDFQIAQPRNGRIFSFKERAAGAWISRVTFSLPNGIPEGSWELIAAAAVNTHTQNGSPLENVVQYAASIPLDEAITEDGWITTSIPIMESNVEIYWWIQNRNEFTQALDEVLLTSRASDALLSPADYTFDGLTNYEDVMIFAALWHLFDPQADLNRDGFINQKDVLIFRELVLQDE